MSDLSLKPGAVTLYAQLATVLRSNIMSGAWPPGMEIPSLTELASTYSVARVTARQAVQILSEEGLLSSHRGRRTLVTYSPSIEPVTWSIGAVERDNAHFSITLLARDELENSGVPIHEVFFGSLSGRYVYLRKIDKVNGDPYSISSHYVATPVFKRFPKDAELTTKITRLVKNHTGRNVTWRERVMIGTADYIEADVLGCSLSAPVARVTRICVNSSGNVLYLGVFAYLGSRYLTERDITSLIMV